MAVVFDIGSDFGWALFRSVKSIESRMRRLIPAFKTACLSELKGSDIALYAQRRLHDDEAKPATVNRELELLRAALNLAKKSYRWLD